MPLDETLRRLPPGAVGFASRLFDFHWSEAAWLYERREALFVQGALVSPDDWRGIEARAEAHVAALDLGGRQVFDRCEAKAYDGDVGELHTAVRLLARADSFDAFAELVDGLDWHESPRAQAVIDALAWDAPEHWQRSIGTLLSDDTIVEDAVGPLSRVVGLRGWPLDAVITELLQRGEGDLQAPSWAAGRLGVAAALPHLYALIEGAEEPSVRQAAAIAALRFAPAEVLAFLQQVLATEDWAAIPFALAAGAGGWDALAATVQASPSAQRVLALGVFGHPAGIDIALHALDQRTYASEAAEALYLLTGAPLHRETHASVFGGEPHEDEFEDDPDDERPRGLLISRLPRTRAPWEAWLQEHGDRLRAYQGRLRFGAPAEPQGVLDVLGDTATTPELRGWMTEELSIRHRLQVRTWPSLPQAMQRAICVATVAEPEGAPRIVPGAWYRAAQPLRTRV